MGCIRKAAGSRGVPAGRHAGVCFLFAFLLSLAAWGAIPAGYAAFPQTGGPPPMEFGNQEVGTHSSPHSFQLQNTGMTVLAFNSIQATANFSETDTCKPSVAVGAHCTISVTFDPSTVGPLTGTLTVSTNAAGPPYVVRLTGTGTMSPPNISPMSLAFNDQTVGAASAPQQVTITNTGALSLSVTRLATSNGWTQSNNCQPSVAPKASCTINVSFQPTSSGPLNGALTITDYASDSPQTVSLSGAGVAPMVSLSATSLTFAGQSVSTTSASQPVTLTNTGNANLTNLTISASGDFAQTNNCAGSVAASASCTINITFTPTVNGGRTGALTLADNAADSPQTVRLSGTGGGAAVWLSTSSLTFPNQQVGTRSPSPQVTLQNVTHQPLNIATVSIGGVNSGDFSLTHNCGNSLAANATCQITVTFAPTAPGARSAGIFIIDSAADSPQAISLSGTGVGNP